jgi:hypothetical protein
MPLPSDRGIACKLVFKMERGSDPSGTTFTGIAIFAKTSSLAKRLRRPDLSSDPQRLSEEEAFCQPSSQQTLIL